jgi:hypothetical protein
MNANHRYRLYAAVFAALVASAPIAAHAMGDEEFVGPFPSWKNVKTVYAAKGDGVTDDTAALQNALNDLSPTNPTIYLPAGTYLITQTLSLASQQYVNIIGQDPSNTTILWGGASGNPMLNLSGVADSRVDRLTFNGHGSAFAGINDPASPGAYFDTGNEYADDVFENVGFGFLCGAYQNGCSEASLLRDKFINNSNAGIETGNYNALDIWVWDCLFQNDKYGVTNWTPLFDGGGDFNVYNSIFKNSTVTDIGIGNTDVFNFRNNYSTGSNQFILTGDTSNPANITVQGNTILDTTLAGSIYVGNLGPVVLLDNTIRSLSGARAPVVNVNSGDVFSMGNTFTTGSVVSPCARSAPVYSTVHCHEINDQVVARSTANPTMPTLPGTPPNNNRQIFEVTPGSTSAHIQTVINNAAASGTVKPVVHIQPGSYNITATLVVPAGSDLQIIGDGYYSRLVWAGTGSGPVIRLAGPSKATLRDFSVDGNGNSSDGIEVDDADQTGSSVFMEQSILGQNNTNLFVDGLDNTKVELHDFQHLYDSATGMTSVSVVGGPSAAQGNWLGGATNIFAGLSAQNYLAYGVSNRAHVSIHDIWNDTGSGGGYQIANVSGASTFSYAGSALYMSGSPSPYYISFTNFQGAAALANLNTWGNIDITGNGSGARVLGLGLVGPSQAFFINNSSPAATTEFLNGMKAVPITGGVSTSELPEVPLTPNTSFLTATLNQLRTEQPTLLAPLPSGVTDVRFYRVFVESAINGIHLEAASAVDPAPTVSLSANPTSISAGQSSTLSWSSTNATSCTGGNFTASGTSGSAVVKPSATTTYSITCSASVGSATATATVSVAASSPPPTVSLSANPTSISAGQSSTLSWSSTNATSCTGGNFTPSGTSGTAVVTPGATTTYSITCSGSGGSATTTATVSVAASSLSPDGSTLTPGSGATLTTSAGTWSFSAATDSSGNIILLNGQQAGGDGSGILLLVYNGGQMYAENSTQSWYQWTSSGWNEIAGDPRG